MVAGRLQKRRQSGAGLFDDLQSSMVGQASKLSASAKDKAAEAARQAAEAAKEAAAQAAKEAEIAASVAALKSSGMTNTQAAAAEKLLRSTGGVAAAATTATSTFDRFVTNPLKAAGAFVMANKKTIAIVLLVLVVIGIAVWYFKKKPTETAAQKAENTANTLATTTASAPTTVKEGFQAVTAGPVDPSEATLVNLQPMAISQAGYLGPPNGGRFNPEIAISQALRSGFRAFVLQIDYLDSQKGTGFADIGKPTLVYRGSDGALLSANSGSIREVTDLLARLAYRPDMPNYEQPIVLYLHVLRTPSPVRAPEAYMRFLSLIAKELNPLAPTHLGLTPLGSFHRQKREGEILSTPITNFKGKTVILSNADTTIFRAPVRAGAQRYNPAEDLDYWVNMRVYLDGAGAGSGTGSGTGTVAGVARLADPDIRSHAVVTSLEALLAQQSATQADAFALKGRRRFVIAMPNPLKNPTASELSRAINEFGVNIVPLDIFTPPPETTKALVQEYTAMTYRPKPAGLRTSI